MSFITLTQGDIKCFVGILKNVLLHEGMAVRHTPVTAKSVGK
jgi:hypothetical protein